jgi:hypothetical protein
MKAQIAQLKHQLETNQGKIIANKAALKQKIADQKKDAA